MDIDITIEKKDNYILVQYQGPDSAKISKEIAIRTLAQCREHDCYRILTLAHLETKLSAVDNYDLAAMFNEVDVPRGTKWAWVDLNPDTADSSEFGALVLWNRGFFVQAFVDIEAATSWLVEEYRKPE